MQTHRIVPVLALLSLIVALLAPLPSEAGGRYRDRLCGSCGTVVDVDRIRYGRDSGTEGAVIGAIIGGAIGNQAGRGDGRRAATVAGAIAGGLIGREVDRNDGRGGGQRGLRLEIRMDRGDYRTIEIHGDMRIYRGDRVRVHRNRVELL